MSEPVVIQSGPAFEPVRTLQRYEHVAERLAGEIRSGAFAPGERLPSERDLARRLEVGRASVREAIAALQVQGVIETRPGSGSFVAADAAERAARARAALPHDASPSDLLEARALLEPAVARARRRARPRRTRSASACWPRWRPPRTRRIRPPATAGTSPTACSTASIAELTGNPVLAGIADHVAALMDQPLWQRLRDDSIATPGRTAIHLAEHRMIYEAIAEGDADAASLYATQHVNRVRRYMTLD